MEYYKSLTKVSKFIGNNPITLNAKSFDKKEDYFVTPKLDGLRKLILFTGRGIFEITSKMVFNKIKLTKKAEEVEGVILDTEYSNKKFFVIDILFSENGEDCRNKLLEDRILKVSEIIKKINSKKIILKEYKSLRCPEILDEIKNLDKLMKDGILDGMIFTPNKGYNSKILKWKPHYLLSNDFEIKNDGDYMLLLIQNGSVFGKGNLGRVKYELNQKRYKDGDIVEFIFENNKFKPIRLRQDKTKANYISVILDNFREMTNPTNLAKLIC